MQFVSFWVFPMVSASCWLTTLFTMLGHWAMIGEPTYARMKPGQTIPYISDIAATELKPVFISGSAITMLCLNISFYQYVQIKGNANKFCTYISCLFAVIGSLGLIMLSAFDNLDHQYMHDSFVTIFIVGYLISAAVICVDYFYLTISHGLHQRMLIASFMIKLSFVIIELAFILAFRITARGSYIHKDTAAVLEWVIAFIFTGYIVSFVVDLMPSVHKNSRIPPGYQQLEMSLASSRLAVELDAVHEFQSRKMSA